MGYRYEVFNLRHHIILPYSSSLLENGDFRPVLPYFLSQLLRVWGIMEKRSPIPPRMQISQEIPYPSFPRLIFSTAVALQSPSTSCPRFLCAVSIRWKQFPWFATKKKSTKQPQSQVKKKTKFTLYSPWHSNESILPHNQLNAGSVLRVSCALSSTSPPPPFVAVSPMRFCFAKYVIILTHVGWQ